MAAALARERSDCVAELLQQRGAVGLGDRVHGIEPQPVEAIVASQ